MGFMQVGVRVPNIEEPAAVRAFDSYPEHIWKKMMRLRQLVLDTASETEGVTVLEETLKWAEPSYLAKGGSTIRMDWKDRTPDQYAMYFNCNTSLVDAFKVIHGDVFKFKGNRAIVFGETDELPVDELKHCVSLALTYHRVKHLPLLGARASPARELHEGPSARKDTAGRPAVHQPAGGHLAKRGA